jgi:hypothetical protein
LKSLIKEAVEGIYQREEWLREEIDDALEREEWFSVPHGILVGESPQVDSLPEDFARPAAGTGV